MSEVMSRHSPLLRRWIAVTTLGFLLLVIVGGSLGIAIETLPIYLLVGLDVNLKTLGTVSSIAGVLIGGGVSGFLLGLVQRGTLQNAGIPMRGWLRANAGAIALISLFAVPLFGTHDLFAPFAPIPRYFLYNAVDAAVIGAGQAAGLALNRADRVTWAVTVFLGGLVSSAVDLRLVRLIPATLEFGPIFVRAIFENVISGMIIGAFTGVVLVSWVHRDSPIENSLAS
jgi:hypothetical protein